MTTYFSIIRGLFIYPEMACFGVYLTPSFPLSIIWIYIPIMRERDYF